MLVGPRIFQAMAEDGLFPASLGRLGERSRVPVRSIVVQGVVSCVALLATGTFDRLLTFATFSMVLFSVVTVTAVVVLRFTQPDAARPFRTPGYPITAFLYVVGNGWILFQLIASGVTEVLAGIGIVLSGVPAYLYFRTRRPSGLARATEARRTEAT
jgi:APA family basic amino acid/polyamine antiporter